MKTEKSTQIWTVREYDEKGNTRIIRYSSSLEKAETCAKISQEVYPKREYFIGSELVF